MVECLARDSHSCAGRSRFESWGVDVSLTGFKRFTLVNSTPVKHVPDVRWHVVEIGYGTVGCRRSDEALSVVVGFGLCAARVIGQKLDEELQLLVPGV
jgi:hypothetical protein